MSTLLLPSVATSVFHQYKYGEFVFTHPRLSTSQVDPPAHPRSISSPTHPKDLNQIKSFRRRPPIPPIREISHLGCHSGEQIFIYTFSFQHFRQVQLHRSSAAELPRGTVPKDDPPAHYSNRHCQYEPQARIGPGGTPKADSHRITTHKEEIIVHHGSYSATNSVREVHSTKDSKV